MGAIAKLSCITRIPTSSHDICGGPSADGLWAEFRIGGTVGFLARHEKTGAQYKFVVRIMKLAWTRYRDRFYFEGELISICRMGCLSVRCGNYYVVGCYEMPNTVGWIQAKRGSVPV